MRGFERRVGPKGRITIPREMRLRLGLRGNDRVTSLLEGNSVRLVPLDAALEASYQVVPALDPPRTPEEVRAIAREEQAQEAAREGL